MEASRPAGMSRKRFCAYMILNRSTLYYKPKGESPENLELMQEIDRYYLEHPTAGVLHMQSMLTLKGYHVNVKRVRHLMRLMHLMHLMPIYPKPSLSKGTIPKYVHPYLLRDLDIQRPNQVWSTDISYIPVEGGFMYLYAVMDVYSRYVLGWRLSNTLSGTNCIDLLEECIRQHGSPEIVNSDQGVQYTSHRWVSLLEGYGIKISMDGRGRCKDNIWIERFWRTIKQGYIYLNPTKDVAELRSGIAKFMRYYNYERPHQSLELLLPARQYGIIVAA